jgi:hypothetical protein
MLSRRGQQQSHETTAAAASKGSTLNGSPASSPLKTLFKTLHIGGGEHPPPASGRHLRRQPSAGTISDVIGMSAEEAEGYSYTYDGSGSEPGSTRSGAASGGGSLAASGGLPVPSVQVMKTFCIS